MLRCMHTLLCSNSLNSSLAMRVLVLALACCAPFPAHSLSLRLPTSRRSLLASAGAACAAPLLPVKPARAAEENLIALGTVSIKPGVVPPTQERGALYVTARVIPSNNVGRYVTAGKVPPLATARFASPIAFPFEVRLNAEEHLTPEFAGVPREEWAGQDLTISARWDTDGTAATRDPDDLVGRGLLEKTGKTDASLWRKPAVMLEGRGLTGRILTGK
tara:strand:+ start:440 stop:1093 length:654 start_codon:yes stop_codon:yes gene_type:complete